MATFFNQATLTYNNTIINSNITTGELEEVLTEGAAKARPIAAAKLDKVQRAIGMEIIEH